MNAVDRRRTATLVTALFLTVALWPACASVRLISEYDELVDRAITDLQKKVDMFLVGLERNLDRPAGAYSQDERFYDEARVDLRAIQVRAAAQTANERTIEQLGLLAKNLDALEALHREGFETVAEFDPLRRGFEAMFTAILKLELAKKRGDAGDRSDTARE